MREFEREIDWLLRDKYDGRLTAAAKKDIERLKSGEHIDYVIGWKNFLGVKVDLSVRPLIPRPETEYWTEKVIEELRSRTKNQEPGTKHLLRILDLFSGSGCVGLAILKHVPETRVDFADIEPAYFKGIRKSARWSGISGKRLKAITSDVFKDLGSAKYDYILANPPYIPLPRKKRLPAAVTRQEPSRALFGGKDGLRFIRILLREGKKHLAGEGGMVIEFDSPQKPEIAALARRYGWHPEFSRDHYGKWRTAALRKAKNPR